MLVFKLFQSCQLKKLKNTHKALLPNSSIKVIEKNSKNLELWTFESGKKKL